MATTSKKKSATETASSSRLAALIDSVTLPRTRVEVVLDRASVLPLEQAIVAGDEAEAERLRGVIAASTVTLEIDALTSSAYRRLEAEHSPRADQVGMRHNPDTFWPAVIATGLVEPKATAQEVADLGNAMTEGGWTNLVKVVMQLNLGHLAMDSPSWLSTINANRGV